MNESSVITKKRRTKLCLASSDENSPLAPVVSVAFGDGGLGSDGEPLFPSEEQQTLHHEIARYPVELVSYPIETTARYTVTIPKNELTGSAISEAALVDSDGDFAAVKNMYPKQKDSDMEFVFAFDDEF